MVLSILNYVFPQQWIQLRQLHVDTFTGHPIYYSVSVGRYYDWGNSYKGTRLTGMAYSFTDLVHCHPGREQRGMHGRHGEPVQKPIQL